MGQERTILLAWILPTTVLFLHVHGSRGPALSLIDSPSMPVAAPPKEVPSNIFPVNHTQLKGLPVISPASHGVKNPSNSLHPSLTSDPRSYPAISPAPHDVKRPPHTANSPLVSPPSLSFVRSSAPNEVKKALNTRSGPWISHPSPSPAISLAPHDQNSFNVVPAPVMSYLGSPALTSPSPDEVKNPSNTAPAPWTSHPSPVISPVPYDVSNPSNVSHSPVTSYPVSAPVVSPAPHENKNPSNNTLGPTTSHSSIPPVISPAPHEVMNPLNNTVEPSTPRSSIPPIISPAPHEVNNASNNTVGPSTSYSSIPPVISSVPHETKNPSNYAPAPWTSHTIPVVSPMPYDVTKPSNISHSPMASYPVSSPAVSPALHEVKKASNNTLGPMTSHSSIPPVISPAPHEINNSSNNSPAPWTSHPSPIVSPVPYDVTTPSNISHSPAKSYPVSTPVVSPTPHEVTHPSNTALGPSTPHSSTSPVISPAPHEIKNPSSPTAAPSALFPVMSPVPHQSHYPSNIPPAYSTPYHSYAPMISPVPHEVWIPPNITPVPSTSHSSALPRPPMISTVPHEVGIPPNITPVPSTSHSSAPPRAPTISPVPHKIKNSSGPIATPSTSFPVMSPLPHQIENPSNIPPAPLTPYPSSSPMINPKPHEAKNHSNTIHAPLKSEPGFSPVTSPEPHGAKHHPNIRYVPTASHPQPPAGSTFHSPAYAPTTSVRHHKANRSVGSHAAAPLAVLPPSSYHPVQGPALPKSPLLPPELPKDRQRHHAPPPIYVQGPSISPIQAPYTSDRNRAPAPSPSSMITSRRNKWPYHSPILPPSGSSTRMPIAALPPVWAPPPNSGHIHSPVHPPSGSFSRKPRAPAPRPVWILPSPPPNYNCNSLQCSEPLANSPPGSPCACVLPIKVGLRLGVALYTFFPLVSELAQEIAAGIFMKQSQVRVMGANAASEDPEKTTILIDLVPLGKYFDNTTAFLVFERFWHKQVVIEASFFGDYNVLYVQYPGLPPSPPTAPSDVNIDNGVYSNGNNARTIHPLGVDVRKPKQKVSGSLMAIIVLSSFIALVFVIGAAWFLVMKHRNYAHLSTPTPQTLLPTFAKSSGIGPTIVGSGPSSASASVSSSIPTYTGSAKTFTLAEIERATNRFDDSRVIGEGGFGRVYEGALQDGTRVAVKVLKRDDQQGGREFLAEVEMLGRLHHRNLVKLIGICTEDTRCLVYELIPNGSVDSHLHGIDKETAPLDWSARVKIALGAARALAYLHEDSSPPVIHRDFKSSNILLEHDFTPKVSDFGLARTAMDGGNEHVSTRVMGTFGYVAPEYAMTGHLLVKSDVYSYGVVLLELLTGRKPVDMLQPPGQENLVSWARPLLTSTDGLDTIIDPDLGTDVQFDSVVKVAAIASMCVQPEVSHRPFMGEVVQALKLVCNEDEHKPSGSCSQEELSARDKDINISAELDLEEGRVLSSFNILSTSARFTRDVSDSFRRYSSSGPLEASRSTQFLQRVRGLSTRSMSEHGVALRYVTGLEGQEEWP